MAISKDARKNREHWDRTSDEYQRIHGERLYANGCAWGVWQIPESQLNVLGQVKGKDILELGCGAAQWSIALAKLDARVTGLDNSARQLEHARRLMARAGVDFPLCWASAEDVPLPNQSFDIVFCDHGALSFVDPDLAVREAARLLRPGGLLAFNRASPLACCCFDEEADQVTTELRVDYFGNRRLESEGSVEFNLAYGEWIRLFRRNGLVVEDLIELRPPEGATTTYNTAPLEWARRWPAETIWKARKLLIP